MIKLTYCLKRQPHLSREAFQKYWLETHGPMVRERAAALGLRRYIQVHTLDDELNATLVRSRNSPEEFDGVAELWWDSKVDLEAAFSSREGRKAGRELLEDEKKFIDSSRSPVWIAEEHPIVDR